MRLKDLPGVRSKLRASLISENLVIPGIGANNICKDPLGWLVGSVSVSDKRLFFNYYFLMQISFFPIEHVLIYI